MECRRREDPGLEGDGNRNKSASRFAAPTQRNLFETCVKGAFDGKTTGRIESKCWSSSGKPVDVGLSLFPLVGWEGTVVEALVVIEDLTERKRATRRLQMQQTIGKSLAEAVPSESAVQVALATVGSTLGWQCVEYWEKEAQKQALRRAATWHSAEPNAVKFTLESERRGSTTEGAWLSQVLGGGKPQLFPGCARDRSFPRSDLAAHHGLDDAIALPIGFGGETAGVLLCFANSIDEPDEPFLTWTAELSGQVGGYLERIQMQESLRRAEEDLKQAHKMDTIGRLVGGVVHDFNNVLTVILGCSEIVAEEGGANEAARELLNEVVNAGKRAAGLTRQLLAFCRKEKAAPVVLDLNDTVREMEKMLRRLIGGDIELETELGSEVGPINADPGHIEQVVMNLIVNARDAMPQGGKL